MDRTIRLSAVTTLIACLVLVIAGRSEPKASYLEPDLWFYQRVIRMMRDSNMQKNVTEDEVAGYYEGLLAGRRVNLLARATDSSDYRFRGDYLYYEAKPNLDVADYDDPALRHVTNKYGMPDVDYTMEASPQTRRLAIVGDSITRGQGAPFGQNFESLLEERLNESPTGHGASKYELLNFSNTGYRITQFVDVALEKAPPFKPDVYVVCLTQLTVSRKWGDHIAQLVWDGIDLKYPFLRELATKAALDPRDTAATMDAKLATHRMDALRWALTTMQAHARTQGADFLVALVPSVNSSKALQTAFTGVRDLLDELGIVSVDLLDTFQDAEDFGEYMVAEGNVHPNARGHRRIFEEWLRRMEAQPQVAAAVLGPAAGATARGSGSQP